MKWTALLMLLLSVAVLPAMQTVKQDGTGDFTTIQAAMSVAVDGDTILVWPGRYIENLDVGTTNNMTLASLELTTGDVAYRDSTIIDGNRTGACLFILEEGMTFSLRGFTLTNGSGFLNTSSNQSAGGAICCAHNTNITIRNSSIKYNEATRGGAIAVWSGSTLNLEGLSIHDNHAEWEGGGILLYSWTSHCTVNYSNTNRCNIYNNHAAVGSDIYYYTTGLVVSVVVDTFTVANPSRYFCNADRTTNPFVFDIQHGWMEETNHDMYVAPWGDDDNDGVSEATPLRSVHLAIHRIATDSLAPKTVHLAAGDYHFEGRDIAIDGKPWVTVQGAGRDATFLYGSLESGKSGIMCWHKMHHFSVKDMTLRDWRRGVDNRYSDDFLLENVIIEDSPCESAQAFYMGSMNRPVIRGCIFRNYYSNSLEPGFYATNIANMSISDVLITGMENTPDLESANAFGVSVNRDATIENLRIINNTGHSRCTMGPYERDAFQLGPENSIYDVGVVRLTNCLIAGNSQDAYSSGQGCFIVPSPGIGYITNCTFADNTGGNAMFDIGGNVIIENNIFWNEDIPYELAFPQIPEFDADVSIRNNCIRNGFYGTNNHTPDNIVNWQTGNVDIEPNFCYTPGLEYVLSPDSPLLDIGAADTTGLGLPPYDLGFNERVWDGDGDGTARIDIGCYELQTMPPPSALEASVNTTDIVFTWLPPASPLRSQTGYRLYRDSSAVAEIEGAMTTEFTFVNAEAGQHSYWLTAVYGVLDSSPTNAIDVYIDPAVYASPCSLTAEVNGLAVRLTWSLPTQQRCRTRELTGFFVYRDSLPIALVDDGEFEHMDDNVSPGVHTYWITAMYDPIESQPSNRIDVEIVSTGEQTPTLAFSLSCNPNPFNPEATIRYSVPQAGMINLRIYNVRGQCVATLVEDHQEAGHHSVVWRPGELASGVYLLRLTTIAGIANQKVVLLK